MRDYLLLGFVAALAALALAHPFAGVLAWVWLSLNNPHQLGWGIAGTLPLNQLMVAVTALGWLISRDRKALPNEAFTWLVVLFIGWMTLCAQLSLAPERSAHWWDLNTKALLLILFVLGLTTKPVRIVALTWMLVLSLAYFGVKGGLWTILTGAGGMVLGPPNTKIEDRNHLALALVMTLPLMHFLRAHARHPMVRHGLAAAMALSALAILGSFSRGGFLAMLGMAGFLWLKSRHKFVTAVAAVLVLAAGLAIMPDRWFERMDTLKSAQQDDSFTGRLEAWQFAFNAAVDRPLVGAGLGATEDARIFARYNPDSLIASEGRGLASHSIYFQVLGDQGFVGLGLFLAILLVIWRDARRAVRLAQDRPELAWARDLGRMCQVSLLGYMIGGAALSLAYYDGFFLVGAIACLTQRAAREALAAAAPAPAARRGRRLSPVPRTLAAAASGGPG
ncbi:putative O-glycosylation ligase, exosortase A system-associated [Arenibaculum pallidiluteum]|uniref:putative O-glycosylation ligase, exosortase A system-associated n=1 Tax=Arenibaculum pallidiluteum TaxID=2812559 RepID=UPI001A96B432|nr:putative O-glycosylation ligase, exosortase A system-associated [Arenibaculum pallidiluteum]